MNFSITQILREINFCDSRSAKYAILTQLEVLNFGFYEILHFLKAEIDHLTKFRASKNGKNGSFRTSIFPKLISRKISVKEKS